MVWLRCDGQMTLMDDAEGGEPLQRCLLSRNVAVVDHLTPLFGEANGDGEFLHSPFSVLRRVEWRLWYFFVLRKVTLNAELFPDPAIYGNPGTDDPDPRANSLLYTTLLFVRDIWVSLYRSCGCVVSREIWS